MNQRVGSFELIFNANTLELKDIANSLKISSDGDPEENLAIRGVMLQKEDGSIYLQPHAVLPETEIEIIFHRKT